MTKRDGGGRLRDLGPDFDMNEPKAGWYQRRLVRFGPFVPARIWIEAQVDPDNGELIGDEILRCTVDGRDADAFAQWLYLCERPISIADFAFMTDSSTYAKFRDQREPLATPARAVNWFTVPPPIVPTPKGKKK